MFGRKSKALRQAKKAARQIEKLAVETLAAIDLSGDKVVAIFFGRNLQQAQDEGYRQVFSFLSEVLHHLRTRSAAAYRTNDQLSDAS